MRLLLCGILIFIFFSSVESQVVQYRDFDESQDSYGSPIEVEAKHIASDFGPRQYDGSRWHGGVDYNSEGDDKDLLLSIFGGSIERLDLSAGLKNDYCRGHGNNGICAHI